MSARGGIYNGPGGEKLHGDGRPVVDEVITRPVRSLSVFLASERRAFLEGMEMAMRICRNRAQDLGGNLDEPGPQHCETCAGVIRIVQVEIGAGRAPYPAFTKEEIDEIERIS